MSSDGVPKRNTTLPRVSDDPEENGYISRRVEEDNPIGVYYSLTSNTNIRCSPRPGRANQGYQDV